MIDELDELDELGELDESDCRNILYNCFRKLETRVTGIFDLGNTTNENQIKDFIRISSERSLKIRKGEHDQRIQSLSHCQDAFQLSMTIWKV